MMLLLHTNELQNYPDGGIRKDWEALSSVSTDQRKKYFNINNKYDVVLYCFVMIHNFS